VTRGGFYDSESYDTWSGARLRIHAGTHQSTTFRVVCGAPGGAARNSEELLAAATKAAGTDAPLTHRICAELHARTRCWAEAAGHHHAAFDIEPNVWDGFGLARSISWSATPPPTKIRSQILEHCADAASNLTSAETLAKSCLSTPPSVTDLGTLERLTKAALNVGENHPH
jgi:hypothetical protein